MKTEEAHDMIARFQELSSRSNKIQEEKGAILEALKALCPVPMGTILTESHRNRKFRANAITRVDIQTNMIMFQVTGPCIKADGSESKDRRGYSFEWVRFDRFPFTSVERREQEAQRPPINPDDLKV